MKIEAGNRGMVDIFIGDGKGKTSTAMWTAVRAAIQGEKVAVIHWFKREGWGTNDELIRDYFENIEDCLEGRGFYQLPTDNASEQEHEVAARIALGKAREMFENGDVWLLVLDEVLDAITWRLIDESELVDLIENRGKTHVVLTGRKASERLVEMADTVTEMKKVKHAFDKGKYAIKGLDY